MSITKAQLLEEITKLVEENTKLHAENRTLQSKEDTHTGILNYLYSSKLSQSKDEVYERWLQMKDTYVKK
jgi:regulator of replication initiation timing